MADQSRGPGRPATGQTPKRYFRMDDDSYGLVIQAAEKRGLTVSDFIRGLLLKAVGKTSDKKGAKAP